MIELLCPSYCDIVSDPISRDRTGRVGAEGEERTRWVGVEGEKRTRWVGVEGEERT
jgi:hypothetical protein